MVGLGDGGWPEALGSPWGRGRGPSREGRAAVGAAGQALLARAELARLACGRMFWACHRRGVTLLLLLSLIASPAALPVGLVPRSSSL